MAAVQITRTVAKGLTSVLAKLLGKNGGGGLLTRLSSAQQAYSKMNKAFKNNPKSAKNKTRSVKDRTDDAEEIAKLFLEYLRESIKKAKYAHKPKSPFTKRLQQVRERSHSQSPLWFTGELWGGRAKVDQFVSDYVEIIRHRGSVTVGFKLGKLYRGPVSAQNVPLKDKSAC